MVTDCQRDDRGRILRDLRYLNIRPHLRPEVEERLRGAVLVVSDPHGTHGNPYLALLATEADRLEKEWELS